MHADFSVESSPTVRKMRPFTRFWRKLWVISILLAISLLLNAISIAFYTPNAMHANFSIESSPTVPKMRPFTRFWRKLCVISVLLEIFRRLNAISFASYTLSAMHVVFSLESGPTVRKIRPFTRFLWQTVRYIGPVGDISISKRCFHRILHAECYAGQFHLRNNQTCMKNATIHSILTKTDRYIAIVGDISTFKRHFLRIFHAECYACRF